MSSQIRAHRSLSSNGSACSITVACHAPTWTSFTVRDRRWSTSSRKVMPVRLFLQARLELASTWPRNSMAKSDLKMAAMTGKSSDQTSHELSKRLTMLLGRVTMMRMVMRDKNAQPNQFCSFTKTGRKLTSTKRWLARLRREA